MYYNEVLNVDHYVTIARVILRRSACQGIECVQILIARGEHGSGGVWLTEVVPRGGATIQDGLRGEAIHAIYTTFTRVNFPCSNRTSVVYRN